MHPMQATHSNPRSVARVHSLCVALLGVFLLGGTAPHEPPDAVVVSDATPELMVTIYPALSELRQPPILLATPQNNTYVEQYLSQIAAELVWSVDPNNRLPAEWVSKLHLKAN